MNRLKNTTCYLCGAMDRVADGGVRWRQFVTPSLKKMGIGVLDPCDKPTSFAREDTGFAHQVQHLKEVGNFDSAKTLMRDIAAIDLRMVDIAHFVIMYMDIESHMCGSYHEAFMAVQQKKPLLIYCKQGKHNVPNWLFGVMPHEHMFSNWDELLSHLQNINEGIETKHYNRWRFFNFDKIFN